MSDTRHRSEQELDEDQRAGGGRRARARGARRGRGARPRDQPPQPARPRRLPAARDRGAVLPAAADRGPPGHLAPDRERQPVLDLRRAALRRRHVRRLRRHVPRHLRARRRDPDRLAGELPDHDGRAGGVADLRGGRRRRPRADGLGAAALGDAQAPGGRQDADLPDPHVHALHGGADRLRARAAARDLQRAGPVRPHGGARDHRLHPHRARGLDGARAARPPSPRRGLREPPRPPRALRAVDGQPARLRVGRHARCAAAPAPSGSRARRRGRLLGVPGRRAVGVVPGVRGRAAAGGAHAGVLRGHVRQPAADAGRRRRRRGRHDRRAGGLRRRRRPGGGGGAAVPRRHVLAADDPRRDRLLPAAQDGRALAPGRGKTS